MNKFYNEILQKLETENQKLEIENDFTLQKIEVVIGIIVKSLSQLKEYIEYGNTLRKDQKLVNLMFYIT